MKHTCSKCQRQHKGADCEYSLSSVLKKLPTPVKVEVLNDLLTGYEKGEIKYLVSGFRNGFRLGYTCERVSRESKNLTVCQEKTEEVQTKEQKEIDLDRTEGPFKEPPFQSCFIISPIGMVPKSEPGQYRLMQHLSYPEKTSIDDGIAEEFKTVSYSEDINNSYTFRGSGCGWYVCGMWAVQGLSTSGLSVGQRRVIFGSLVGHHQAT